MSSLAPNATDKDTETTWVRHDADGTVLGTSSDLTMETIDANGGRTWTSTITDEQGGETTQRGATYEGRHGGSEVVTTNRADGTTRVDTVTWSVPREGTRTTVQKDEDGNITSSSSDDVIRNDQGNWEHNPSDSDDDPEGDNPVPSPDGGDDDGAEGGGDGAGDFGPGGPDGGGGDGGGDGGDGGDGGGGDGGDGGDGPPPPPGPHVE